jgi:hypothetical protein
MNTTTAPRTTANPPAFAHVAISAPIPAAVARLVTLKGQFVVIRTVRDLKTYKGTVGHYEKDSTFTARIGVDYDNISAVKEKRETGELPAENAGLPWGSWLIFPYIIAHKGNHYVRCTSVNGNAACVPTVRFLKDGKEISKEAAMAVATAAEKGGDDERDVFTIKVESITHINGKPI